MTSELRPIKETMEEFINYCDNKDSKDYDELINKLIIAGYIGDKDSVEHISMISQSFVSEEFKRLDIITKEGESRYLIKLYKMPYNNLDLEKVPFPIDYEEYKLGFSEYMFAEIK